MTLNLASAHSRDTLRLGIAAALALASQILANGRQVLAFEPLGAAGAQERKGTDANQERDGRVANQERKGPVAYPDPAVEVVDPRFAKYKIGNAAVERLYTGTRWSEGPVWLGD